MPDAIRSKIMRSIPGKNTRPELLIRRELHKAGFRFRKHYKTLKGKPDIVLPKHSAIVLVNGCFWHGHECHIFRKPRQSEWREKIEGNKARDAANIECYKSLGWKVLEVWECAIQGKTSLPLSELVAVISNWIQFDTMSAEITGRPR